MRVERIALSGFRNYDEEMVELANFFGISYRKDFLGD